MILGKVVCLGKPREIDSAELPYSQQLNDYINVNYILLSLQYLDKKFDIKSLVIWEDEAYILKNLYT